MSITPEQFCALELWILAAANAAVRPLGAGHYGAHEAYEKRREDARALLSKDPTP
jgi:hypothetical protein